MLDLPTTIDVQLDQAQHKVESAAHPWRYLVASMLAGMYIGIGVVLMVMTAGPLGNSPLVAGAVFGVALTLVVFAGAELVTSAMMILPQAAITRSIGWGRAIGTLLFCFFGNLVGSVVFAWMIVQSRVLDGNAGGEMLAAMIEHKNVEGFGEMFFRGVLCNVLVCVAIWAANRLQSEAGKAIIIFWCILAFIASGFEHVVANMTTFSIALFQGGMTDLAHMARNLAVVGLGNLVGGAVVIGVSYLVVSGRLGTTRPTASTASPIDVALAQEQVDRVEVPVRVG